MSAEDLKNFLEQVNENEELKAEFKGLEGEDAIVEKLLQLSDEMGYEFSEEEARRALQQFGEQSDELTDEQLEQVSGGFFGKLAGGMAEVVGGFFRSL